MAELNVDPEVVRGLIKVRDDLIFWLTEQSGPPEELKAPLWEAFELLNQGVTEIAKATGVDDAGNAIAIIRPNDK
jgi:hypothetical protein